MNLKSMMIAVAALTAPAAAASAQDGYGYLPPPPYAYAGVQEEPRARTCDEQGFTILGAHAGVTVLGFGLNGGASFTAPTGCGGGGYGYGEAAPQFEPRPYAPPMGDGAPPHAYAPPSYAQSSGYEGWTAPSYGYAPPPPCGCGPQGW